MIVAEIHDLALRLRPETPISLEPLSRYAARCGLELPVPRDEIEKCTPMQTLRAIFFLNEKLLLPQGEIAILNFVGARAEIGEGRIERGSIKSESYLGSKITIAPVVWSSMMPNCPGLGVSNWAIFDIDKARADAIPMYQLLNYMAIESPLARALLDQVGKGRVNASSYAEKCGHQRIRNSVIGVAENNVYFSAFGLPFAGTENPIERVRLLTKTDSALREMMADMQEEPPHAVQFTADSISHYCSSLRGIMRELRLEAAAYRYQDVRLKALDYIVSEVARGEMKHELISSKGMEATSASLFTSALAESGHSSHEAVLTAFQKDGFEGAREIQKLFQTIYDMDFRSEAERAQLIANPQSLD